MNKDLTLWEHAKAFYKENFNFDLPDYNTEKGRVGYELWVSFAFKNLHRIGNKPGDDKIFYMFDEYVGGKNE